jgi:hypothetical protein
MNNASVFWALMCRDLIALKKIALSLFLDNVMLLFTSVTIFGYLLPAMGMNTELIGPLFLGQTIISFVQIAHSIAAVITRDLETSKVNYYQITLPLSQRLLLLRFIIAFVIKSITISIPLLFFGIFLLGNKFVFIKTHILSFALMYILVLIFFATLFLLFSFSHNYEWFRWNLWARRIEPLFLFGSVTVVWKQLYLFSKPLGVLFLFNPLTYAIEGLRTTLIGGDGFLPLWVCIPGICVGIAINWLLLVPAMNKKLDLIPETL